MERALEAIGALTQQVSRLAFAAEAVSFNKEVHKTCRACSSRIQRHDAKRCLACGEDINDG
jgi:hypothetical protein